MKADSEPVSFRASRQLLRQIDARREPFGISRGDWVRGLVMQHLAGADMTGLASQLETVVSNLLEIHDQAHSLKRDLARSVYLLLVHVGNLTPDEAKKIVQEKLLNLNREAP